VTALSERFDDALRVASDLHREQVRKGSGVPYVSHLLAVASIVLEHGGDEDEAIAALLHDAVEDQGGAPTETAIRARFGETVAGIVRECSAEEKTPGATWRQRKERYIAHLAAATPSAVLVSLADKLHNARSILRDHRRLGVDMWEPFNAGPDEQQWYYRSLLAAYRVRAGDDERLAPLVDELARTIDDIWPDDAHHLL
jgi:(p)ppGpp synthase/HD superfamily hydrolase